MGDSLEHQQEVSIKGLAVYNYCSILTSKVHYSSMEGVEKRELQLLLHVAASTDDPTDEYMPLLLTKDQTDQTQVDLSLSMSTIPPRPTLSNEADSNSKSIQVLKNHAAEQVRVAALERVYAERMRELTRRELELAEKEFARARLVWEHAREEVEKVERMKMTATRRISANCIEITCQACRKHFKP